MSIRKNGKCLDIVALQSLHYLTLALLGGAFNVGMLKDSNLLAYTGPVIGTGMLMDWREMAGRPTFRRLHGKERWSSFTGAWSGGRKVAGGPWYMGPDGRGDYVRGWILAACWVLASTADVYYLYHLVRRPRLILDFTSTLHFNHLVLKTYYSTKMCVKREMAEGLVIATNNPDSGDVELGTLRRD
ncbi:hypothetical protein BJV78DRAFT_1276618 [Lactifluus subvellereus]|nr:hypothetical protein BJV78DRAFT_1276618 [Lactifluus subvellereus]